MKKSIFAAAVLAAVSFGASAAETASPLSYTYAEAGYTHYAVDTDMNSDLGFAGWYGKGSFAINDQFNVIGGYAKVNNDEVVDTDLDEASIGLGWHTSIADNSDAILELSYLRQGVDASFAGVSASDHANGYRASAGLRSAFNDRLVGTLKVNYTDGSDIEGEFTPTFGVEFKITPMWSVAGDLEFGEGNTRYTAGVRANF